MRNKDLVGQAPPPALAAEGGRPTSPSRGALFLIHHSALRIPHFLLLLLLAAAGCRAPGQETGRASAWQEANFFPFYESSSAPGGVRSKRALGPLFAYSESPHQREWAFRPLIADQLTPNTRQTTVLWPLAGYRRDAAQQTAWVLPVFWMRRERPGGREALAEWSKSRWMLLPFLFGGRVRGEGRYFACFPVAGLLRGLLGKREIRFFLFPLHMETREEAYHAWHVLFPVFARWRENPGQPRWRGWRVWPLYGQNCRWSADGSPRFRQSFALWPLINIWHVGLDTRYPTHAWLAFPLYGRLKNPNTTAWTFLMLFGFRRVKSLDLVEVHAPWPVFAYARGRNLEALKVWPLFGYRNSSSRHDWFILWPAYRRRAIRTVDRYEVNQSCLLIFHTNRRTWLEKNVNGHLVREAPPPGPGQPPGLAALRETAATATQAGPERSPEGLERFWRFLGFGGTLGDESSPRGAASPYGLPSASPPRRRSEVYTKLWPLFHYRRTHRGEREFQMLSPLMTRDPGAFRAHYGPFISLAGYHRDYRGRRDLALLFGLIRHANDPVRRHLAVNCLGLVDYRRRSPQHRQASLLFGCFGRERFGKKVVWRFLWIPFGRISRAERLAAMLAEEREMRYRARAAAAGLPWE